MTEGNERIATLESKMDYVMGVLAKREDYQASVLKQLTVIEIKQDQFLTYQKTCEAERAAHATRIGAVENVTASTGTAWGTLMKVGTVAGVLLSLAVSALNSLHRP